MANIKTTKLLNKLAVAGTVPKKYTTVIEKLDPALIDILLGTIDPTGPGLAVPSLADDFRADIPVAQEGDLITSDYHNSLRDAVIKLADRSGGGAGDGTSVLAFAPALHPTG